jgi:peptidoglycan/xylan/chitin deacetylase (PgdA/CDA1 family)
MTLPAEYLRYPHRRRGLDHDWFEHRSLFSRSPVTWPGGRKIALCILIPIEFFPLAPPSQPFRPLGGLDRPYPDLWSFANRDYGNRVGLYRIMRVLDRYAMRATALVNAQIASCYPRVIEEVLRREWEIVASGLDMATLHHGALTLEDERAQIAASLTMLRAATERPIHGWHSPAFSQSMNTLRLLREQGISYVADWINDDLPYEVRTPAGSLCALPLGYELSDRKIFVQHDRTVEEYEAQVLAAFRQLLAESERHGGCLLTLSVSPWIIGYPHRIHAFERVIEAIAPSVWAATGAEIIEAFKSGC